MTLKERMTTDDYSQNMIKEAISIKQLLPVGTKRRKLLNKPIAAAMKFTKRHMGPQTTRYFSENIESLPLDIAIGYGIPVPGTGFLGMMAPAIYNKKARKMLPGVFKEHVSFARKKLAPMIDTDLATGYAGEAEARTFPL